MTKEIKELSFFQKINKIQTELIAPKDLNNKFGNYKYRSCESILKALKPLLQEYELILIIQDSIEQVGDRFYIKAKATIKDGDKEIFAVAYAREALTKKGMDESQVTGAASSYARKYALNGLLCIDDTKDADSKDNSKEGDTKEKSHVKKISNVMDDESKEILNTMNKKSADIIIEALSEATSKDSLDEIYIEYKPDMTKLYKYNTPLFNKVKQFKEDLSTQLQ
tara:strand:+ start:311 stop:982 length:672 start_codon:yes stop_codon:yes gene_type:complete